MFFLNASGPEKFKVKLVGWSPGQPGPVCAGVCVVILGVGGGGGGQPGCVCVCACVHVCVRSTCHGCGNPWLPWLQ